MSIITIVLVLLVLGILLYFIFRPSSLPNTMLNGPISLSTQVPALSNDNFPTLQAANAFLKDGQGTFQCFVYLDLLKRTGKHVACGTDSHQPDCSSGLYGQCTCSTVSDCTNCAHDGYESVFNLYGAFNFEVMNVPDASRPSGVAAQLSVRTETTVDGVDAVQVQTIPLPPLDQQKWVMITICKEGRRIDVYYNNALVTSSKMINMISTKNPNGTPVTVGDPALSGQIAGLSFFPNRMTVQDVSSTYSNLADTRGNPIFLSTTPDMYGYKMNTGPSNSLIQTMCLDGSCISFPQISAAFPQIGQPDISSYTNIFRSSGSSNAIFTTQYA